MNNKLISKVFKTTLIMFFVLTIYTIPTLKTENVIRTNLEIEDITNVPTTKIYLLNRNNLLVQTSIFINTKEKEKVIKNIIDYLIIDNENIPLGLHSYLPKNTKLLNVSVEDNLAKINISREFLETDKLDIVITGLVYSLISIEGIDNVSLLVDNKSISNYDKILNKNIGINKDYSYNSRTNIEKTTIYYLNKINNDYYYIPVTKYLNDNRDKIEVIIDELINNQNNYLVSPINNKTKLLDYKEINNVLYLNFNKYFIEKNDDMNKKIQEMIAYSAFDNYDIDMVMFEVNGKKVNYIKK